MSWVSLLVDRALAFCLRAAAVAVPGAEPRLDLHGLGVRDAIAATEKFLAEAQRAGTPRVRIVYGKGRHSPSGRGVLREVIPRWLAADGRRYVASATPLPDASGEDGAIEVRLARHDDVTSARQARGRAQRAGGCTSRGFAA